jgi:hydrogenase expression/formation protein HypC
MCMGIPMQVQQGGDQCASCHDLLHPGETVTVDLSLVGPVQQGDWLLVFAGAARELLLESRAREILQALEALDAAMNGCFDPNLHMTDLTLREPALPAHLQCLLDEKRKTPA